MDGINCLLCLNLMQTLSFSSTGYCYRCRRPRVWHTALLSVWRLQHGRPPSSVPDPPAHRRVVCVSGYRPRLRADGPRHPDQSWGPSGWTFHFVFQAGNISSFGSHLPTHSVFYIIFSPHDREAWALRPTCTSRWRTWMITLQCSTRTSTPWASAATRGPEPRSSTSSLQTETRAGSVRSPMNSSLGTCPVCLHWINKLVCGHNNNTATLSVFLNCICISFVFVYHFLPQLVNADGCPSVSGSGQGFFPLRVFRCHYHFILTLEGCWFSLLIVQSTSRHLWMWFQNQNTHLRTLKNLFIN